MQQGGSRRSASHRNPWPEPETASSGSPGVRVKVAGQHQLERHFVRAWSQTEPNAGFDSEAEELAAGAIHDCPDFVKLLVARCEVAEWAEAVVGFRGDCPPVIEVVGDTPRRVVLEVAEPPVKSVSTIGL